MNLRNPRLLVALAAALAVVPLAAVAHGAVVGTRATLIISPPPDAGASDGRSDNVTFSQDNRDTRLVAFDSVGTNIVPGDDNGATRDIFLKVREQPGANGNFNGSFLNITSRGNGDSQKPSISGDTGTRPNCVVFESVATNLARGDRSSDSDIFLYDVRRRRTSLVSVGARGATNGIVDGECEFVTYQSRNNVYVRSLELRTTTRLARGTNPDQATNGKFVAYERGGQIFVQEFFLTRSKKGRGPGVRKKGRERVASASAGGERGNGPSANPSMDDNGFYVAFESVATNLCDAGAGCPGVGTTDRNGTTSDIFRRNINPRRAPTNEHMAMVSYSQGCSAAQPDAKTVDAQGDGPSNNPAMTGAGENIVFDSEAQNLRESAGIQIADGNGSIRDIYYWNFPRGRRCGNVSRESRGDGDRSTGQVYNGASTNPAASSRANFIGFTSIQTGQSGETNGADIADVFARFLGGFAEGQ